METNQNTGGPRRGNTTGPLVASCLAAFGAALLMLRMPVPDPRTAPAPPPRTASADLRDLPFAPLERPQGLDAAVVSLGRTLFHDPRLSRDGSTSCASCHDLAHGGDDGLPVSIGVEGREGLMNAPTVLNSGLHPSQFWDGRAATLEEQVDGPLHNPVEMDTDWATVVERLADDPNMVEAFHQAFGGDATPERVRTAIATFERSLVTTGSPFDRWLEGDDAAFSEGARRGLDLFIECGCASCHQGRGLGGNLFQRLGVMRDYFAAKGPLEQRDLGRFNHTQRERDRHVFRVPSLRNVALTAPYFHDGSAETLGDAVRAMMVYQIGVDPEDERTVALLVEFLESLTGDSVEVPK